MVLASSVAGLHAVMWAVSKLIGRKKDAVRKLDPRLSDYGGGFGRLSHCVSSVQLCKPGPRPKPSMYCDSIGQTLYVC